MDNVVDVTPKHSVVYEEQRTKYLTDRQFKIVESAKTRGLLKICVASYLGDKDNKKGADTAAYTGKPDDMLPVWFQMCDNTLLALAVSKNSYSIDIDKHKFHFLVTDENSGLKLFEYRMCACWKKKEGVKNEHSKR